MAPVHIFYPFNYAPISNETERCRPSYFMIYPKVAGEQVIDQAEWSSKSGAECGEPPHKYCKFAVYLRNSLGLKIHLLPI